MNKQLTTMSRELQRSYINIQTLTLNKVKNIQTNTMLGNTQSYKNKKFTKITSPQTCSKRVDTVEIVWCLLSEIAFYLAIFLAFLVI